MVPGQVGDPGLGVPEAVVEEQRPGGDSVTVQPRPTVVQTVWGITLNRNSATLSPVLSQVNNKCTRRNSETCLNGKTIGHFTFSRMSSILSLNDCDCRH